MLVRCLPLLLAAAAPASALGTGNVIKVPQDFFTIQDAVDAAADGDTIQVGAGTYLETVVIDGFTDLVVRGKGKVVIDSDTGAAALTLSNSTDCVVEKIRAEDGPGHGFLVLSSTDCTLSKCRVENVDGDGVRLDDCTGITVSKCNIRDTGDDSIALAVGSLEPAIDCTVTKNKCRDSGLDGVGVNGTGNLIEKNQVKQAGNEGLDTDETTPGGSNVFLANRVIKPAGVGIRITGTANEARENKVVKSGERAVHVEGGSDHVVEGNKLAKAGNDGIRVESGVNGVSLLDNKVPKAGDDGIEVDGDGATIDGNKISGADEDGFEVDGDDGFYIGNKANGCKVDGFHLSEGSGNTLTQNKAHGNKGFDLNDETGGANTIAGDNKFGTTSL